MSKRYWFVQPLSVLHLKGNYLKLVTLDFLPVTLSRGIPATGSQEEHSSHRAKKVKFVRELSSSSPHPARRSSLRGQVSSSSSSGLLAGPWANLQRSGPTSHCRTALPGGAGEQGRPVQRRFNIKKLNI